ncbi:Enhanced intracellular survival protein [Micromonospora sp. MW-13]|uniref:GNAT family N-acetyltransferase n=1 Tax=unclassified Micromonospora TaxID=2617518 RepID=UPI000E4489AC|nr:MULTISPECIES: GNAT family N-acetyltransferase [unclassified Micromonospora]MCX4468908.1 GNAT family N-acetyltransferase [Micromonospora sp. NBC_01655]RGC68964.1 Enhanced intracellular survival protein [Micromonospora sp. MW-13]
MSIRRVTNSERLTTSFPLQAYAFEASPKRPERAEAFGRYLPYGEANRTLVVEEGGETLAVVSAIPMRQNLRGAVLPMAGVAGVATHPLARRRGHVRALLHQLLDEMRDEGHLVSALYPFRASFYERFGYVGLPRARTVTFTPADLAPLLRADLPGELSWERTGTGYAGHRAFTERLLAERHGFALFPDTRAAWLRDDDDRWLVTARVDGATVGVLTYRIDDHGGELTGDDLLVADPYARALILAFLARHVDQVGRVRLRVAADELPELWLTDLAVHVEARVARPGSAAPMARLLSLDALAGLPAGPGRARVALTGDRWLGGSHLLDGTTGRLELVSDAATGTTPTATLTAAGLSALVYGVLDPAEVDVRGLGQVPADAAAELRRLFPRRLPYLYADF